MRSPPPLLLAAALALALAPDPALGQDQDEGFVCDIPTAGCTNGMFNQALCICECISPFCPDINGDCTNVSDNCGGNPWKDCTQGVNCPWWVSPLKAESCFTGPEVPLGLWQVYNTRAACCNSNFPYSEHCDAKPESTGPTLHPTIALPEDDIYEVIPIKFDVSGLPVDINMRDLKDQMNVVLKRILLRLSERIPGLKISSVQEKVVINRALAGRGLQRGRDVSLYFDVYVIRDEGKKFGPLIISEIRDSYDEVLDQIQTFADTKYFSADLNLNWCTSQNGKFELCVKEIIGKPPPEPPAPPARPPTIVTPGPDDNGEEPSSEPVTATGEPPASPAQDPPGESQDAKPGDPEVTGDSTAGTVAASVPESTTPPTKAPVAAPIASTPPPNTSGDEDPDVIVSNGAAIAVGANIAAVAFVFSIILSKCCD